MDNYVGIGMLALIIVLAAAIFMLNDELTKSKQNVDKFKTDLNALLCKPLPINELYTNVVEYECNGTNTKWEQVRASNETYRIGDN